MIRRVSPLIGAFAPTALLIAALTLSACPEDAVEPVADVFISLDADAIITPDADARTTPDADAIIPDKEISIKPDVDAIITPDADATIAPDVDATVTPDADATVGPDGDTTPVDPDCDPTATPFGGTAVVEGVGTFNLICSAAQLDAIRTNPIGNYGLTQDIDLTGTLWTPIPEFQGVLAGQDFSIIGLSLDCTTPDAPPEGNCAFIKNLTNGGTLSDIRFTKVVTTILKNGGVVAAIVKGPWVENLGKPATPAALVQNVHVAGDVTIDGTASGGVFRALTDGAIVDNVSFEGTLRHHAWTSASHQAYIGGISWRIQGNADVTNVSFKGLLDLGSHGRAGGIGAEVVNVADIRGCRVEGVIRGADSLGGVAETFDGGYAMNCSVDVDFQSTNADTPAVGIGGAFSTVAGGTVENIHVTATASGSVFNPDALVFTKKGGPVLSNLIFDNELDPDMSSTYGTGLSTSEMVNPGNVAWAPFADGSSGANWIMAAGSLPELAFVADLPTLEQPETFACGSTQCVVGAQVCEQTVPDCAEPTFGCNSGRAPLSAAACATHHSDDLCACLVEESGGEGEWSCIVNDDGNVEITRGVTCGAVVIEKK